MPPLTLEMGPRNSIPPLCPGTSYDDAAISPIGVAYFTRQSIGGARMRILPDCRGVAGAKRRGAHREGDRAGAA
jgi:hypothetical protein